MLWSGACSKWQHVSKVRGFNLLVLEIINRVLLQRCCRNLDELQSNVTSKLAFLWWTPGATSLDPRDNSHNWIQTGCIQFWHCSSKGMTIPNVYGERWLSASEGGSGTGDRDIPGLPWYVPLCSLLRSKLGAEKVARILFPAGLFSLRKVINKILVDDCISINGWTYDLGELGISSSK